MNFSCTLDICRCKPIISRVLSYPGIDLASSNFFFNFAASRADFRCPPIGDEGRFATVSGGFRCPPIGDVVGTLGGGFGTVGGGFRCSPICDVIGTLGGGFGTVGGGFRCLPIGDVIATPGEGFETLGCGSCSDILNSFSNDFFTDIVDTSFLSIGEVRLADR